MGVKGWQLVRGLQGSGAESLRLLSEAGAGMTSPMCLPELQPIAARYHNQDCQPVAAPSHHDTRDSSNGVHSD